MARNAKAVLREALGSSSKVDVESAWRQEVAARVAALDSGEVETTSWEVVRDRFLARLSEKRQRLSSLRKDTKDCKDLKDMKKENS